VQLLTTVVVRVRSVYALFVTSRWSVLNWRLVTNVHTSFCRRLCDFVSCRGLARFSVCRVSSTCTVNMSSTYTCVNCKCRLNSLSVYPTTRTVRVVCQFLVGLPTCENSGSCCCLCLSGRCVISKMISVPSVCVCVCVCACVAERSVQIPMLRYNAIYYVDNVSDGSWCLDNITLLIWRRNLAANWCLIRYTNTPFHGRTIHGSSCM